MMMLFATGTATLWVAVHKQPCVYTTTRIVAAATTATTMRTPWYQGGGGE